MGKLEKCPVCGVAVFAEVHVPLGGLGGMTMYVHSASLRKQTRRDTIEEMIEDLEHQADEGGEACIDLRYALEDALDELPEEDTDQQALVGLWPDSYIAISGCRVDKPAEEVTADEAE